MIYPRVILCLVWGLVCVGNSPLRADSPTWVDIEGSVYGAQPDQRGPLGGGEGYADVITSGDYSVEDVDALLDALSQAQAGQVIRGTPQDKCEVHHNWFLQHATSAKAVGGLSEQTRAFQNAYGLQPTAAN